MKEQIKEILLEKIAEKAKAACMAFAECPYNIVVIVSSLGGAPLSPGARLYASLVMGAIERAMDVKLLIHEFKAHEGSNVLAATINLADVMSTNTPPADSNDCPDAA